MLDFSFVINNQKEEFTYHEEDLWGEGNGKNSTKYGLILPASNDNLQFDDAGSYISYDLRLYTEEDLKQGNEVEVRGRKYKIYDKLPWEKHAGFKTYLLRASGNDD